ncbi:MAG: hypothetical protein WBF33_12290 [Candidatus Nitrosopolaris sp.]
MAQKPIALLVKQIILNCFANMVATTSYTDMNLTEVEVCVIKRFKKNQKGMKDLFK